MKRIAGCLLATLLCLVAACVQNAGMLRVVVQDEEIVISRDEIMGVTRGRDAAMRDYVSVVLAEDAAKRIGDATARHVGGTMSLYRGEHPLQTGVPISESFAPMSLYIAVENEEAARRLVHFWGR